ncbi:1-acyl-sn-glycerol-3-phosphate acyltransferase [Natronocella acetinitrilica]|uniref:1-acyl-sn-glycerol-3-phosphate acyltransferase n=1 Tax=Natronocella acetinitrilica TaxID=414046 RepID=A0AAE3G4H7_9GAMM|nr:1-acyl-sn-glycerol-3-phosphate acyltransferase [Natronocella acetinitrilica]MCP1674924.1 1-acyl-sn-glycerol-3-phosphate acyltransferase [Natronocella acetinitrilica]
MRFYWAVMWLVRGLAQIYFLGIHSSGLRHVPASGPVILAANHPSSLLDSVLLSAEVDRPVRYLARSGLFRFPLVASLFRWMGAIPVYRAAETGDAATRNEAVFSRVRAELVRGGCIGIFPEGRNSPRHGVAELRKGAARLALDAEAAADFQLGLRIVPVGINFENRDFFMSSVLLRFGPPISVADYADLHRHNANVAVRQLTSDLRDRLLQQASQLENQQLQELVDDVAAALRTEVTDQLHVEPETDDSRPARGPRRWLAWLLRWYTRNSASAGRALEQRIHSRQYVTAILQRAEQQAPGQVERLRNRVNRYKDHLAQGQLRLSLSHHFEESTRQRLIRLRMTAYAIAMAPVAAFGLVHNIVPYLLTAGLARLYRDDALRTFAYFAIGVLVFLLWYAGLGWWLWRNTALGPSAVVGYLALLPPTGLVALSYRRSILYYRERILVRTVFLTDQALVDLLVVERRRLAEQFSAMARRFGPATSGNGEGRP